MLADAIGLDIGGANLKVATSAGEALTRPFELWKHPDRLAAELRELANPLGPATRIAVTMTGELCDCFRTKRDGVRQILAAVARVFPETQTRIWSTAGRFVTLQEASEAHLDVAAANWHAQATFAGRFARQGPALLIDTGSTTTDIVPLRDGQPVPASRTDTDRLRSAELIYTGVRRTPVCAVLGPSVAAELFATTLDVYLRLGLLPEAPDDRQTADGRPATADYAHARLARMLGGDGETTPSAETEHLARRVFERQTTIIRRGLQTVGHRLTGPVALVILSGSGEFLARSAAEAYIANRCPGTPLLSLSERLGPAVASAACAFALALLAGEDREWGS